MTKTRAESKVIQNLGKRPKDKSKYLNSVDLKQNTITQKKFLRFKMSPGVQHTPLPSTSSSKEPEVMEMKLLVKEEINNSIYLKQYSYSV